MRLTLRTCIVVFIVWLAPASTAAPDRPLVAVIVQASDVATELVPFPMAASNMAAWWKPIDVRGDFVYLAYDGPGGVAGRHRVHVAKRSLIDGSWSRSCLRRPGGACETFRDDVGHRQPTIALDGVSDIHVFAGMHHNPWNYYRSRRPRWVTTIARRDELPNPRGRMTYPVATMAANGDVWLMVRQSGISPIRGRLYRWQRARQRWYSTQTSFASAAGFSVYPDDIVATSDGRMHLLWSWAGGHAGALHHAGSYMVYDPATRVFTNAAGDRVATPAKPTSSVVYQPLEEGEAWSDVMTGPGIRGAKLAIAPDGHPVVAYRYQEPGDPAPLAQAAKVRIAEWDGTAWQRSIVHEAATSPGLGLTYHADEPHVYIDAPAVSGTVAVRQDGDNDYIYRAAAAEPALYYGRRTVP